MTRSTGSVRRLTTGAASVLLAVGLAGCGGSDDPAEEPEPTVVTDTAQTLPSQPGDAGQTSASPAAEDPAALTATLVDFAIEVGGDDVTAGTYTIEVVNEGGSSHDLVVERDGEEVAASPAIDPGRSTTLTVTLGPGEYVLYCSVANHRAMGMETTIEVS